MTKFLSRLLPDLPFILPVWYLTLFLASKQAFIICAARRAFFRSRKRLKKSRREVCRGVALIIITVGPEADVMPANSCQPTCSCTLSLSFLHGGGGGGEYGYA